MRIIYATLSLEAINMVTKRTFVMLEPHVRDMVKKIARKNGISISMVYRDLKFRKSLSDAIKKIRSGKMKWYSYDEL